MGDLKQCPFCGSKAEIIHIGNEHTKKRRVEVRCTKRGCFGLSKVGAIYHSMDWCEEKAIAAWNQRFNEWLKFDDVKPPEDGSWFNAISSWNKYAVGCFKWNVSASKFLTDTEEPMPENIYTHWKLLITPEAAK